jgi:hypothetical protein
MRQQYQISFLIRSNKEDKEVRDSRFVVSPDYNKTFRRTQHTSHIEYAKSDMIHES